jgi:hypothetical protein
MFTFKVTLEEAIATLSVVRLCAAMSTLRLPILCDFMSTASEAMS